MQRICLLGLIYMMVAAGLALESEKHDYNDQGSWEGSCTTGSIQSPINILSMKTKYCPDIGYYKLTVLCQEFEEDYVGADYKEPYAEKKAYAFFYDRRTNKYQAYRSLQLHWHTSSEHNINGVGYSAEMHLFLVPVSLFDLPAQALGIYTQADLVDAVENNKQGLVIAFLLQQDQNAELDLFDGIRESGEVKYWNLNTMLGCAIDRYYYMYEGSTTTPPCLEGFRWMVTREPLPIKPATLAIINEDITYEDNTNHRDTQPLNGRNVYVVGAPCVASMEL